MAGHQRFIGIDLGGARGKSTAVAQLRRDGDAVRVEAVRMRGPEHSSSRSQPWSDEVLLGYLKEFDTSNSVVAINAPLAAPACVRCTVRECPGDAACTVPAVRWLRETGMALQAEHVMADPNRIVALHQGAGFRQEAAPPAAATQRLPPYTHRCTEVDLHFRRGILAREQMGQASWAIVSRASFLRRRLEALGFRLNQGLLEVSPRCTVHALFGEQAALGYKRDADPWHTRASVIEGLEPLRFAPQSGMSKEDVLRNDNCFDALISAYTGFLWARDDWSMPADGPFDEDGWIWAPPEASS